MDLPEFSRGIRIASAESVLPRRPIRDFRLLSQNEASIEFRRHRKSGVPANSSNTGNPLRRTFWTEFRMFLPRLTFSVCASSIAITNGRSQALLVSMSLRSVAVLLRVLMPTTDLRVCSQYGRLASRCTKSVVDSISAPKKSTSSIFRALAWRKAHFRSAVFPFPLGPVRMTSEAGARFCESLANNRSNSVLCDSLPAKKGGISPRSGTNGFPPLA